MFGIGLPELILIMAVALIVVGPEKLPELAKGLAKQLIELKKAANVLKESLRDEDEPEKKDWDSDLPIGFSRPEELAEAGRRASEINHSDEPSDDESSTDQNDDKEHLAEQGDVEAVNTEEPGEADSGDNVDPVEMAENKE